MLKKLVQKCVSVLRVGKKIAIEAKFECIRSLRRLNIHSEKKATRVKLVAIAKDEAAYLPEWIFHHLYFGFDQINIYVNNTRDCTDQLAEKFTSHQQVFFRDGDKYFSQSNAPQVLIYTEEVKKSRRQGFSHVMFLDIDEFWLAQDFETSIKQFISNNPEQIYCFEWLNRTSESESFSAAIQPRIEGQRARQIKSLMSTDVLIKHINPHGVLAHRCCPRLADGESFKVSLENFSKVDLCEVEKPLKPFFILHRMYRSELEYVALLLRGRPIKRQDIGIFKGNRKGYTVTPSDTSLELPAEKLCLYKEKYKSFIDDLKLAEVTESARKYVVQKRFEVAGKIKNAPQSEAETLRKVLRKVTLEDINQAYGHFKSKHKLD
jgi:hypothetical protein